MDTEPDKSIDIDWSSWENSIDGGGRSALEGALRSAYRARTGRAFGSALKEVLRATGRTQGDVLRHDSRTEDKWLSKSTVSRLVNGHTIGRNREQVEAFVRACGGVEAYVDLWGNAWTRLRAAVRSDREATVASSDELPRAGSRFVYDPPKTRWREPATIAYQRRADPVLEPTGLVRPPGAAAFIVVCGMGSRSVFIRWYARSAEEARATFRQWLGETWQTLTTDFSGVGVPNGLDFKPSRIDWFSVAGV